MTLLSELADLREEFVYNYIDRMVDGHMMDYSNTYPNGSQIKEWRDSAYVAFRTLYPEVNNLFISHT